MEAAAEEAATRGVTVMEVLIVEKMTSGLEHQTIDEKEASVLNTILNKCTLRGMEDVYECGILKSVVDDCNIENCFFESSTLTGCKLKNVELAECVLINCTIEDSNIVRSETGNCETTRCKTD